MEVQMKLRSHWLLLCKFKWHFIRQIVGQGEQHRWVYRAPRGAQEARESCTDGRTGHNEAQKSPGRAVQTGVQITKRRSRGQGELHKCVQGTTWRPRGQGESHKRLYRAQLGAQEARESCTNSCTEFNLAPKRPGRAAQTVVQSPTWRPRGSKLSPRGVQDVQVGPKRHPRGSKLGPRGGQEAPSSAQEAFKRSNLKPKT